MTNMKSFSVTTTSVEGTIPPAVFDGMRKLTEFIINDAHISGKIPTEIGYLERIVKIECNRVDLSGTIPTEVGLLTSLEKMFLSKAHVTGTLPTELGRMVSLVMLFLVNNDLQGTIPIELEQLTNLNELVLTGNLQLNGKAPDLCGMASKASMLNPSMPENFNPLRTVFLTGINPLWVDRKGIFWFLKQSDWFIVGILKSINARA
eukprot:CAMPEP_0118712216 /NCGR_PEP_ID=MMETSP0800-20121206/24645_1 /TAXON_ID=210618 ORGANISM="Striatella unipunctata, Strain CCMP2910" /NCGR_SAMPLE_ID=MMETSP0800 /ASSEMBLY_ACC=CAM_ASM_000638 /LENGTH=204 /DNA_ID=CAMNT_0006617147 /DNA_START=1 /DNA_END=615 /DNA_ORIENTATION=+